MKLSTTVALGLAGGVLIYAGVTGNDPRSIVENALTGKPRRPLGDVASVQSSDGLSTKKESDAGGGKSGKAAKEPKSGGGGGGGGKSGGGSSSGGCSEPKDLVSRHGRKATRKAWEALSRAEAGYGKTIGINSAYRSCKEQEQACNSVCPGSPGCAGCSGSCAPCGESCHQDGEAFDIVPNDARVRKEMHRVGFCNFGPSDPKHWCLSGCR